MDNYGKITISKQMEDFRRDWRRKNTVFCWKSNFSLCAKFNRFFIILGGVQNDRKTTILVVLGSHILGFWGKIPQKPWYLISVFRGFLTFGYTGDRTPYTGKMANFTEIRVKNRVFSYFLLGAKFNRFFIILGGPFWPWIPVNWLWRIL